jgi:hypothetical protein
MRLEQSNLLVKVDIDEWMMSCRAFLVPGRMKPEEAVQATLSSLPDEVIDSVGVTALGSEDSLAERRRKLEFLQQQEALIKEEAKKALVDQEEKGTTVEDGSDEKDRALRDKMLATAREAQHLAQTKTLDKRDELCKLSAALAVLASASVSPFLSLFDLSHTLRWFFLGKNCNLCMDPLTMFSDTVQMHFACSL